jgi:hypothetical protein
MTKCDHFWVSRVRAYRHSTHLSPSPSPRSGINPAAGSVAGCKIGQHSEKNRDPADIELDRKIKGICRGC